MPASVEDMLVVERFLNTLDERSFVAHGRRHVPSDELTSVEALSGFLEARGLLEQDRQLRPADLTDAIALRAALREALLGGTKAAPALAGFPLRLAPDSSGKLRIAADGDVAGLNTIVETVATSVADGDWRRLKLCAAEDCRWAFYDTSRNGGGRWCHMEACGNRNKTRAYRHRSSQK